VTLALRLKVGGMLVLALAGLLVSAMGVISVIPVTPPALMAPAVAVFETAIVTVKVIAVAAALVAFLRSRD
jgi:hypothetical protein